MAKYDIDKSFGMAARFNMPLNKVVAFASGIILKNSAKCLKHNNDVVVKTEKIDVRSGAIKVHIIMPNSCSSKNPCLFYIHGGGFAYDAPPYQYKNVADYAVKTGSVVVFPHYRLTPGFAAPVPSDDCLATWEWMLANADAYKIDLNQIGIGGDSAGGYLAARLTNHVVKCHYNLQYQMLIYPVIDSAMRTESMHKYTDTPMWNAMNNKVMWRWYYGEKACEVPLLDESLPEAIPPTYIETAEFDCLHDEGLLYGDKLKKVGVKVTINETRSTMHGFDSVACEITKSAVWARAQFISEQIDKCR